ncbi:MAG: hypothetical protein KA144_03845 [Xanthomonadaceae bacterium]|nr:hypothetical protein [Xanthomonadaceae bacterium]
MKFREIASRLTGFSTPIFGISWNPPETEIAAARRLITFLEDRRVLYVPSEAEVPNHCIDSILEIRRYLTSEMGDVAKDETLGQSMSAMRAACRKFLDATQVDEGRIIQFGADRSHYASWVFIAALGELRGIFGLHIARIATAFGLDVESQLAVILPAQTEE